MKYPDTTPRPTDPNAPANPKHTRDVAREGDEPTQFVSSRLTTDGTRYLLETFETTDGTRELPHPMTDPMTGLRGFQTDWPIGDPRRGDARDEHGRLIHTTGDFPGGGRPQTEPRR